MACRWAHRMGTGFFVIHLVAVFPAWGESHGGGDASSFGNPIDLPETPSFSESDKQALLDKALSATDSVDLSDEEWAKVIEIYNEMAQRNDLTQEQKSRLDQVRQKMKALGKWSETSTAAPKRETLVPTASSGETKKENSSSAPSSDPFVNFQKAFSDQETHNRIRSDDTPSKTPDAGNINEDPPPAPVPGVSTTPAVPDSTTTDSPVTPYAPPSFVNIPFLPPNPLDLTDTVVKPASMGQSLEHDQRETTSAPSDETSGPAWKIIKTYGGLDGY
jgi:hypothetical protein